MTPEQKQIAAALSTVTAIAQAIRELGSVPSGHLYAQLMGHISFETYNASISVLKRAGLVEEQNYLLTWVGPRADT